MILIRWWIYNKLHTLTSLKLLIRLLDRLNRRRKTQKLFGFLNLIWLFLLVLLIIILLIVLEGRLGVVYLYIAHFIVQVIHMIFILHVYLYGLVWLKNTYFTIK
jgi:hypothetical protein